ncbi:MAG: NeuD/PglB/VioB family sugar acetyltransferase [Candidatus Omnitrophica bacterium]|nr:NeuD/PglB/VioB family sugar acetyltransferase [Candidatus Omnitrophota bacterium]MDD4012796.1 NeuD/PglB/VioB family sugar acetyltransferase [Candidatus Omnitrophota bacterium]
MISEKEEIVLVGGGGHCKVIIDAIRCGGVYEIFGIIDPGLTMGDEVLGVKVIGTDDDLRSVYEKGVRNAFISVGSVGISSLRKKIYENIRGVGFKIPIVIHPKTVIAGDVEIGEGTFVAASATINTGTIIGKNVIVNTASSLDHDCRIGDFVHVAPGATLSGGVDVGEGAFIGTGAKVTQYATIDRGVLVKACSLVYKNSKGCTLVREFGFDGEKNVGLI